MKKLIILGSTGSIGTQALDIVRNNRDKYCITALAAGRNIDLLEKQAREFCPKAVAVFDESAAADLKVRLMIPIYRCCRVQRVFVILRRVTEILC